jgi:hypothetical protein
MKGIHVCIYLCLVSYAMSMSRFGKSIYGRTIQWFCGLPLSYAHWALLDAAVARSRLAVAQECIVYRRR